MKPAIRRNVGSLPQRLITMKSVVLVQAAIAPQPFTSPAQRFAKPAMHCHVGFQPLPSITITCWVPVHVVTLCQQIMIPPVVLNVTPLAVMTRLRGKCTTMHRVNQPMFSHSVYLRNGHAISLAPSLIFLRSPKPSMAFVHEITYLRDFHMLRCKM